jgi:bacterial/archaeal transporter family-2 protein
MAVLFSILAGSFAVLQTGLNKIMSETWGFSSALLLNGIVFLVFNLILFGMVWIQPRLFPSEYLIQGQLSDFKWLWILPGLFGFLLVMGLTVASSKIGAVPTFVISIAAQIIMSIAWDSFVDSKPLTAMKVSGAILTFAGAFIATR